MLSILICKVLCFIGEKLGRGSSLPGAITLKLSPNILSKIKLPETVIAVTGSNGKTSLTEMLCAEAKAAGKRVVCNSEGSNQIEGVTTALLRGCNLKGEVQADVAILESDERFCQYTFKHFAPNYIVVTNLFRDQLTRNGNSEFVLGEVKKGIPAQSKLFLNADDPVSASLGYNRQDVAYYSVEPDAIKENTVRKHAYDDGAFCPVCNAEMSYSWRIFSHLGAYRCKKCGFKREDSLHSVTGVKDGEFILDKKYSVKPQILNNVFAYNIAAAFSVATEVFGLSAADAAAALSGYKLTNERIREFTVNNHKGLFLLSKHENSISYDSSLSTVINSDSDEITVVLIVDLLSRKYIANDMSWLWDIDFNLLCDKRIKNIILSGGFANDLAARLLFSGVDEDVISVEPDLDRMMELLYGTAQGDVFVMTCFTDVNKFTGRLRG